MGASGTTVGDHASCPSCGAATDVSLPYPSRHSPWRDLTVCVCDRCGFGWVPEIPFDLGTYYANEYGKSHGREGLEPSFFQTIDTSESRKVKRARWHAQLLHERFGSFARVLDIGAGPGFFLHYVQAAEKVAVETDRLSQRMLAALGVKVIDGLENAGNPDAIVLSHVLEHIPAAEYKAFAQRVVDALAPGGVLLIEVPSWGFLHRDQRTADGKTHDPHTLFFSMRALLQTVEGADLVLAQNDRYLFTARNGRPDRETKTPKPVHASSLLGVWHKA
jgi:SAM-dependent methyltransferase